jgi:hypothetical protein
MFKFSELLKIKEFLFLNLNSFNFLNDQIVEISESWKFDLFTLFKIL